MRFVGTNEMKLNKDTVEQAISQWLNDDIYSKEEKLIVAKYHRHQDGSMTIHFERRGPLSDRQKERLAAIAADSQATV